ncbi:MAG: Maf family protein, partial [Actinomycetota bacterium]
MTSLVLASRSPRRADILRQLGIPFVVDSADVDETPLTGESPRDHVRRLAVAKCLHVAARHPTDAVVLGADTTVDVDGEIFGTPRDVNEARAMLRRLSGRTHLLHTAVCVARGTLGGTQSVGRASAPPVDHPYDVALDTATVAMHPIDTDALERYLATGESLDKAGAYAVQGEAAQFVREVTGHLTTVVGLPVRV